MHPLAALTLAAFTIWLTSVINPPRVIAIIVAIDDFA
jgi:hypothetical protein